MILLRLGTIADSLPGVSYFIGYLDSANSDNLLGCYVDPTGKIYGSGLNNATNNSISTIQIDALSLGFAKDLTGAGTTLGQRMTGDGTDVYTSGYESISAQNRALIAKYNSSGTLQWQRSYYINLVDIRFYSIVYMANGDLAAVGLDASGSNAVVATLQTDGTAITASRYNAQLGHCKDVDTDTSSNLYVVGQGNSKATVAKLTSGLTASAGYQIDATVSSFDSVTVDGSSIYAGGSYNGFGTNYDAIIYSFDTSLNVNWSRRLYSAAIDRFYGTAVDSQGNVYAVGHHYTPTIVGLIAKYDSSGTLQWQRTLANSSGNLQLRDIYIDSNDALNIVGITATSGSGNCQFVTCLPNDGTKTGAYVVGTETFTYAVSTLTDASISPASTTNTALTLSAPTQATPTFSDTAATTTLELEGI